MIKFFLFTKTIYIIVVIRTITHRRYIALELLMKEPCQKNEAVVKNMISRLLIILPPCFRRQNCFFAGYLRY